MQKLVRLEIRHEDCLSDTDSFLCADDVVISLVRLSYFHETLTHCEWEALSS